MLRLHDEMMLHFICELVSVGGAWQTVLSHCEPTRAPTIYLKWSTDMFFFKNLLTEKLFHTWHKTEQDCLCPVDHASS